MPDFMFALICFVVFALLVVGYVANIVKLVKSKEVTGLTLARVVGIFIFPIGAIVGFISN
jgi:hypothetical protein